MDVEAARWFLDTDAAQVVVDIIVGRRGGDAVNTRVGERVDLDDVLKLLPPSE